MTDYVHVVLVYFHLLFLSLALSTVLLGDVRILREGISADDLAGIARRVSWLLLGLWCSGLAIVAITTQFDPVLIAQKPKLQLKVLCVAVLTVNGYLLHRYSFAILTSASYLKRGQAQLLSLTGGLSTSHWLLAAFIGVAVPLNSIASHQLLGAYLLVLVAIVAVSLLIAPKQQCHINCQRARSRLLTMGIRPSLI